jgi:hypothetical protein
MPDEPDYYEVLQVSPRAESAIIDTAYRKLAQKYHPDVNPNPSAHQRMRELNHALEILSDPRKREAYDRRRQTLLAQRAIAARPMSFVFPTPVPRTHALGVGYQFRRRPVTCLTIAGGVGIALVTLTTLAMWLASSGGGESSEGLQGLTDFDGRSDSPPAERAPPAASPTAEAAAVPPATPTPSAAPTPTPEALAAVRGPTSQTGAPTAATPTPAAVAVPPPAPAPDTPPASTPQPATPAPPRRTPTPSPAQCSVGGAPQLTENGNHLSFSYGEVVTFQPGQPDILVVDVAGTVLALEITGGTDVQGELDAATVVNGEGRRSRDGSIAALLVEVLCP